MHVMLTLLKYMYACIHMYICTIHPEILLAVEKFGKFDSKSILILLNFSLAPNPRVTHTRLSCVKCWHILLGLLAIPISIAKSPNLLVNVYGLYTLCYQRNYSASGGECMKR